MPKGQEIIHIVHLYWHFLIIINILLDIIYYSIPRNWNAVIKIKLYKEYTYFGIAKYSYFYLQKFNAIKFANR